MTKAFGFPGFGCSHRIIVSTCFSKFWRRSDAVPLPRARAFELAVSIPALPEQSSEENAWFRALPSGKYRCFSKIPFWNCVIGFDVVSANTSGGPNELSDDSIGYRILWNRFRKIDDRFAKPGRSFFQIVNAFCLRFFADKSCAIIPKRIVGARIPPFQFRHWSFELRHFT
jgi:hypothetical protein